MSDITIPRGGIFSATWYVSGTTLTGAFARIVGFTSSTVGSPYLFDWSTSGGQMSVAGSQINAWVNASGTSGLNFTIGTWELATTLGSSTPYYDTGRVDLLPYNVGGR